MRLAPSVRTLILSASFLIPGCTREPAAPAPDAGVADAGAQEIALEISTTGTLSDGGTVVLALTPTGRTEVDPLIALQVEANLPLTNYRVRVFDEADRAVASDDEVLPGPAPVTYRIQFPEPLPTGFQFDLVMDAQTGEALVDASGKSHPDVRLGFQILGEKQKPPPPPRKANRRR